MKGGLTALSDVKQPSSQVINIDSSRSKLGHSHPLQRTSGFNGIGQSRFAKRPSTWCTYRRCQAQRRFL